ncbi:hypothetical protein J6590_044448 [Homalodisca vitripennis]|nr:hypothetical protein J6590_044448 [Homalodisca vitripennis]
MKYESDLGQLVEPHDNKLPREWQEGGLTRRLASTSNTGPQISHACLDPVAASCGILESADFVHREDMQ